jgi:CheY-like chemotaxis protein
MSIEHEFATTKVSSSQKEVLTSAENSAAIESQNANHATPAEFERLLREGITAAKAGNLLVARQALLSAVAINDKHEMALMWLASISDQPQDLLKYLQKVLIINPANERAAQWAKATKSLLAKLFIQQGAATYKEGMPEVAGQYFLKAAELEPTNEIAWLWLVSVSTEPEDKLSYLQKVLNLNPQHEKALALFHTVKNQMARVLLKKGNAAVAAGDYETAREILRDVIEYNPNLDEAWILKAHLSDSPNQKIYCFEKALEINSENELAAAELAALRAEQKAALIPNAAIEIVDDSALEAEFVEEIFSEEEFIGQRYAEPETTQEETVEELFSESEPATSFFKESQLLEPEQAIDKEEIAFLDEQESFDEYESVGGYESFDDFQANENFQQIEETDSGVLEFRTRKAENLEQTDISETSTIEDRAEHELQEEEHLLAQEDSSGFEQLKQSQETQPEIQSVRGVPFPQEAENVVTCQFCQSELPESMLRCRNCGSFVRLEDFEHLLANELIDEQAARDFIDRLQVSALANDLSAEEHFNLGLAYLNLRNLKKGVVNLEQAMRLNRENEDLNAKISALLAYIKENMPESMGNNPSNLPSGKTIMVVDDSPTVRKLIVSKLEKYGHRVISAVDGMDALSKINEDVPDLILLDVTMPRMDGYQLCKVVRSNVATKHVPIVMISGKDGFFDKVRGRMAGSTAYITKPFGPDTLLQTVETHCK